MYLNRRLNIKRCFCVCSICMPSVNVWTMITILLKHRYYKKASFYKNIQYLLLGLPFSAKCICLSHWPRNDRFTFQRRVLTNSNVCNISSLPCDVARFTFQLDRVCYWMEWACIWIPFHLYTENTCYWYNWYTYVFFV